jgi:hypothetical protein
MDLVAVIRSVIGGSLPLGIWFFKFSISLAQQYLSANFQTYDLIIKNVSVLTTDNILS